MNQIDSKSMTVKVGDTTINTDNVFAYKYDNTLRAEADKLRVTSSGGKQLHLSGRKARALRDWLDDRSETLGVEAYDNGAIEYDGH